jgi:RimJ/RimL family protein N-acetyltransferase
MALRPATREDIPQIAALERLPESRKYVGQWTEERHERTLLSADARYLVYEAPDGALGAYVILRGFEESPGSIELKRVVVASPGRGLGRRLLGEILQVVFDECRAHRLFLDVFEDNQRAQHVYRSLGFVQEGVMRDAAERDGNYFSLHLMSILESEYRASAARLGASNSENS